MCCPVSRIERERIESLGVGASSCSRGRLVVSSPRCAAISLSPYLHLSISRSRRLIHHHHRVHHHHHRDFTFATNEPTNSMIPRRVDVTADDDTDTDNEWPSVCAICQHQVREPLVTQCRHSFCGRCIKALLDNASMRPIDCPVCRSPIFDVSELCSVSSSSSPGSEEAETRCPNQAHGCSWRGCGSGSGSSSGSLEHHLSSTCMHHPCPNRDRAPRGCSWVGSMGAAIIHQATECDIDIDTEHHRAASSSTATTSTTTTSNNSSNDNNKSTSRADKTVRAMLSSRVFAIDVGDRTFRATEQTLRSESGSVLDRMFSGEYELPRGSYHLGFQHRRDHHDDHDHDGHHLSSSSPSPSGVEGHEQQESRSRAAMSNGGCDAECHRREEARVFIDCDARSFEHALHWLRSYVSRCDASSIIITIAIATTNNNNSLHLNLSLTLSLTLSHSLSLSLSLFVCV